MRGIARQVVTGAIVTVTSGFAIFAAAPHYTTALVALTRAFSNPWSYACLVGAWYGVSSARRGIWRLNHADGYDSGWVHLARLLVGVALVGASGWGLFVISRG